MKSQNAQILKHLKSGKWITPLGALKDYGCFRLGARIWDLKQQGHKINRRMVSRSGKRFALYEMK